MFEVLELGIGLDIVLWFQSIRFGALDNIALLFHYANGAVFYIVVLGTIYWMFDKKLGARMVFALIIIGLTTLILKDLFARPRPHHLIGSPIIPIVNELGFGIPSGHVSMTLVIWGYFAYWMQKRWITLVAIVYVILMGLSRMYLGVHFPQDVIAGWLLGGVVLWLYVTYIDRLDAWWQAQPLVRQISLPIALGIVSTLFLLGNVDGLTFIGLLIGAGIAIVVDRRYIHFGQKQSMRYRLLQVIIGLIIAFAILEGLDLIFDSIAPPSYIYVDDNVAGIVALRAEVGIAQENAPEVCLQALQLNLEEMMTGVCDLQITPLASILRVIRFTIVAFFALSIIPYFSIRLNLMDQDNSEL